MRLLDGSDLLDCTSERCSSRRSTLGRVGAFAIFVSRLCHVTPRENQSFRSPAQRVLPMVRDREQA